MSNLVHIVRRHTILLAATAVIALSSGGLALHHFSNANAAQPAAMAERPAVPVGVVTVSPESVRLWSEFSGRLNAVDYAEIRPEVSGRIAKIRFTDGQSVKAGDVLFVIDPRPYEAAQAKAQANLASARAKVEFANTELNRAAALIKTQAIAQSLYEERSNTKKVADAAVQTAEAELKQAQIDVDRAYVKAPIAGRLSRAEVTQGNLVQAGPNAQVLTSIVSNDGIYADFEVDEQTYLKSIRANADTEAKAHTIPVELNVQGDAGHVYRGTIQSFDNRINTASGTIRARARFDSKDGTLVPGMFVSVKLGSGAASEVLLIPERAVGNDQSKKFVYVVGNDGRVTYREVNLGPQVDGRRIVLSGLQTGERVVVDGLQHIAPDVKVEAREAVASLSRNVASRN